MNKKEMPKTYDFASTEQRLYHWWEESGWFKPECAGPDAAPYVISIPPPNVTGALHQGHALFVALEDLMIRHARMRGYAALWVPGSDHAGIATQLQVEKMLEEEGTSRQEIGRKAFLQRTWDWKKKYGGRITEQLRRLGASCDWDRERFTLDNGLSHAVREAFVRWYEQGLIYRGTRLINWSPNLQTAVSDLEVERIEQEGKLYFFKYPIKGEEAFLPVATTRPETILGDTAVAVHPDDERYQAYIGKTALVPMLNREIPIIADEYVDMEFGTGALKLTPGHDPNDYEIGIAHGLEMINILNKDATLNENAGPYARLDRFEARDKLWADMESAGLTLKTEPYTHAVPIAQRGGELIEPMISTQWFADVTGPAQLALEAVRDGRIQIVPERFTKVWEHWLTNIQPWCISRQLWWGHRIPAWHCADCGEITVLRDDPDTCIHCGSSSIEQDPDVLDTWFSSGLWPFSTLGWPEQTPDLARYYPTTMMETGYDILFFWVARMVMMGLSFTGTVPFSVVYLHGIVRDEFGRKMSKTSGNVADPIEVMDEFGTDALRFTLLTGSSPGNDMNLSLERIASNRNFANKIWNAARFLVSNLDGDEPLGLPPADNLSLPDRWILSLLHHLIGQVNRLFEGHLYGEAGRQIVEFLWGEYADWYIEISKIWLYGEDEADKRRTRHILTYILDLCLRMLHPFIPYVTEEIWQHIPHEGETIMYAPWPEADEHYLDEEAETGMDLLMTLVKGIRNIRSEYKVPPSRAIEILIEASDNADLLTGNQEIFNRLANADPDKLRITSTLPEHTHQAAVVAASGVTVFIPLADLIDIDAERLRLRKELEQLQGLIARAEAVLANNDFVEKAPEEVVRRERDKLADLQAASQSIDDRLKMLD
nr:valine--tRNA ligase [Anaerolineae bacterium]